MDEPDLYRRLADILRACPALMRVLGTARELDLPDWLVMSGAVYQPVLNHLTGRALDYGIKDYDLGYFDRSDVTYEAEDVVIRRAAAAFDEPLKSLVEVRNQARVHLWFPGKFGEAYAPLTCTAEALGRFATTANAVGVQLRSDDSLKIIAPFGLRDLFDLRLRPNPWRKVARLASIIEGMRARWPELTVEEGI